MRVALAIVGVVLAMLVFVLHRLWHSRVHYRHYEPDELDDYEPTRREMVEWAVREKIDAVVEALLERRDRRETPRRDVERCTTAGP